MKKTTIFSTLAVAAALALGGAAVDTASAKPGWKGGAHAAGHGVKAGWHGAHRPPGWSHGRKRGWHKGSVHRGRVPPGWR